ncbi:hypothetical protein FB451DRAFT_1369161 [Mycena latifolia]|nr:hypothetical protein FB451DRAFT_1369161 [Mycena latifolia]
MPAPALQWPLPPPARTILVDTLPPSSLYSTNQPRDCIMLCAYILSPLPPCDYAAANLVAPHPARRAPRTSASTFRVSASMCSVVGERNTARTASRLRERSAQAQRCASRTRTRTARALRGSQRCARPFTGAAPRARRNLLRIGRWLHAEDRMMTAARHRDAAAFTVAASTSLIDEGVAANNGKSPVDKTGPWSIARSSAPRTTGARIATS